MTTGAEALVATLADGGVRACFANPGTSEMHLVAAVDREPRIRPVLCLFEGVASGAADGYARIAGQPAMTLLHLGSGLSNASANLHNARRAGSPMVNVIGDHAGHHLHLDAPLTSDIDALAGPVSTWLRRIRTADEAAPLAARALAASAGAGGGPVSLVLQADAAWNETPVARAVAPAATAPLVVSAERIAAATAALRAARKPAVLVGSPGFSERSLESMARIAGAGIKVIGDTFVARWPRGAGRFSPGRLPYFAEQALAELDGVDLLLLAGTKSPVAFFAYPGKPSSLAPPGTVVRTLCAPGEDVVAALAGLAAALGAAAAPAVPRVPVAMPTGALTDAAVAQLVARHLPDDAILCDDAVTAGLPMFLNTVTAAPHDWLMLTGGAIGLGLPLAVGASVAAPGRKVLALSGDGAAAYTVQALWTMARERLDVITIVFANRIYRILHIEMQRTGAGGHGAGAQQMLSLGQPDIDWVSVAQGFGVRGMRATSIAEMDAALAAAMGRRGSMLIEAVLASQ